MKKKQPIENLSMNMELIERNETNHDKLDSCRSLLFFSLTNSGNYTQTDGRTIYIFSVICERQKRVRTKKKERETKRKEEERIL
jgi:hypothetical protein